MTTTGECAHCGAEFVFKQNHPEQRYCSKRCGNQFSPNKLPDEVHAFRRWARGQRKRATNCIKRQAKRRQRYERSVMMRDYRKPCAECHEWFTPKMKKHQCCSYECSNRRYKRIKRASYKARRRAGVNGNVDPIAVFARDRWHCQCCGIYTQPELRGSYDPTAPELDHIVPLSKGGEHSVSNTQLLCRSCNGIKSDELWPHPFVASWASQGV